MTRRQFYILFTGLTIFLFVPAWVCAAPGPRIIEDSRITMGTMVRVQVAVSPEQSEALDREAIDKAFREASALSPGKVSMGYVIDRMVAVLKECGVNSALVNSDQEMRALGMKNDKEMWKAWIPHPTDKKKIYAKLGLKDRAIATVRNDVLSASVVADDADSAEKLARDLLAQGADGLKSADVKGLDALLITKDGNKFKTEMAGGFKEQYGKSKK